MSPVLYHIYLRTSLTSKSTMDGELRTGMIPFSRDNETQGIRSPLESLFVRLTPCSKLFVTKALLTNLSLSFELSDLKEVIRKLNCPLKLISLVSLLQLFKHLVRTSGKINE